MAQQNVEVKRRSPLRKGDKRSKFVGITTTPANHRDWRKRARAAQKSLSSWIRDCLNGEPTTGEGRPDLGGEPSAPIRG